MGKLQAFHADAHVVHYACFDWAGASSAGVGSAGDLKGVNVRIFCVDSESLRCVVENEPACVAVHCRLYENQAIRNYIGWDAKS